MNALNIISNQSFEKYGIRVINTYFDDQAYSIGDILPPSYRWEDGEPTEDELYGVSAIEVNELNFDCQLAKLQKEYGCLGSQIVLIGSHHYVYGEDECEIEMKDAIVLAILSQP